MAVSASAEEYQYKKVSLFLKYDLMKIRKEKVNKRAAIPRTTCRNIVGPIPCIKKGGIMPFKHATVNRAMKTIDPA